MIEIQNPIPIPIPIADREAMIAAAQAEVTSAEIYLGAWQAARDQAERSAKAAERPEYEAVARKINKGVNEAMQRLAGALDRLEEAKSIKAEEPPAPPAEGEGGP